jgi:putative protease
VLADPAHDVEVASAMPLEVATNRPLTEAGLRDQLGRLGGTVYELAGLDVVLSGNVILPVSELNRLRRAIVERLEQERLGAYARRRTTAVTVSDLLPQSPCRSETLLAMPELRVLCRTEAQVDAALACGIETLYADFEDVRRYRDLVARVRDSSPEARLYLATPRIQKAGEKGLFRVVENAKPHGVLVRNLGGIGHFKERGDLAMAGDFSLNVANPITARLLLEQVLESLTISYDLNISQVLDLLAMAPPEWFELTLHQHMPMFHMEHCVFCTFLSKGKDFTDCGRPCDTHVVHLRDRVGQLHRLTADVGCRNTLFNGRAQSGARFFGALREAGLRRFRVELLDEGRDEAMETIRTYQGLLRGDHEGTALFSKLKADSRLGVVEGTLEVSS